MFLALPLAHLHPTSVVIGTFSGSFDVISFWHDDDNFLVDGKHEDSPVSCGKGGLSVAAS